ncbi:hypothetical protein [Flavimaricola marinus]|uniref:Uncharacterized protein n=1 Tax=Flavimaricola marinus TaxID=1819565 RepID=A0A238LG94_9RHOB|nr:hypothetical protein [Flavimaricola marinus]SMY08638.1 hypothetical protein LOM8899_02793 [Flavimaricola marinus]
MGAAISKPLTPLRSFLSKAKVHRDVTSALKTKAKSHFGEVDSELRQANDLALSCLCSQTARAGNLLRADLSDIEIKRSDIHAEFIKGLNAFEYCLESGLYGASATLARREIEAVNVCVNFRRGKQKNKKNPGIKAFKRFEGIYKQLSGIAHNTDQAAMSYLSGGGKGNLDPRIDCRLANFLLGVHIHSSIAILFDMSEIAPFSESCRLDPDEQYYSRVALGILVDKDIMNLEPK